MTLPKRDLNHDAYIERLLEAPRLTVAEGEALMVKPACGTFGDERYTRLRYELESFYGREANAELIAIDGHARKSNRDNVRLYVLVDMWMNGTRDYAHMLERRALDQDAVLRAMTMSSILRHMFADPSITPSTVTGETLTRGEIAERSRALMDNPDLLSTAKLVTGMKLLSTKRSGKLGHALLDRFGFTKTRTGHVWAFDCARVAILSVAEYERAWDLIGGRK